MSKLYVCAVRDSAMQAYARPMFVPALGLAIRSFQDEVNRTSTENTLNQHPDDFELVYLTTFSEETGEFNKEEDTRVLSRGKDAKRD